MPPNLSLKDAGAEVWDVIVLGAGPAGAIAANQLARSGTRTLLVDKRLFPRSKVCGACLNAAALEMLNSIGLRDRLVELGGVELNRLELRFAGSSMELDLPGGLALSRDRLDEALVDLAVKSGARFLPRTEGLVGPIEAGTRRATLLQTDRAVTARARVILLATGLGQIRFEEEPTIRSCASARSKVGAGCVVRKFPGFYRQGIIFMTVGEGGYVGLVRVENHQLNVAAAFDKNYLRAGGNAGSVATGILLEAGLEPIPDLEQAVWRGTIALTRKTRPVAGNRLFVLGDAAGYVEPFTGEGMAWAMTSGKAVAPLVWQAVQCWDPSLAQSWESLHRRLVSRRHHLCGALSRVLDHPRLARAAFGLVGRFPALARLMIAQASASSVLSLTS